MVSNSTTGIEDIVDLDPFQRSEGQKIAIATIPKITGSISFLSSATMLYMILQSEIKLGTPFRRLIFAMCIIDLLQSGTALLSTLPSPMDTPGIWGARGNTTSCSITGFIFQYASTAAPLYMCSLCVHYLCFVQYKITQRTFRQKIEPLLHLVPNVWCLWSTIFLAATNHINQADVVCWIAPQPYNCINSPDIECIRGERSYAYRWIFGAAPNALSLMIINFIMFKIYFVVKEREKLLKSSSDDVDQSSRFDNNQVAAESNHNERRQKKDKEEHKKKTQEVGTLRRAGVKAGGYNKRNHTSLSDMSSNLNSEDVEERIISKIESNSMPKRHTGVSPDENENRHKKIQILDENFGYRSREARNQAFLFVGSFFFCYVFVYINGPLEQLNIEPPCVLRICLWSTFPLQGFFNIIIFTRPHVTALMQKEEGLSSRQAVWKVIRSGGDISRKLRPISTARMKRKTSLYWRAQLQAENGRQQAQAGSEVEMQSLPDSSMHTNTNPSLKNDLQHVYPSSTVHSRPMSHIRSNLGANLSSLGIESFDDDSGASSLKLDDEDISIYGSMYGDNDYDIYDDDNLSFEEQEGGESHTSDFDDISYDNSHNGKGQGRTSLCYFQRKRMAQRQPNAV